MFQSLIPSHASSSPIHVPSLPLPSPLSTTSHPLSCLRLIPPHPCLIPPPLLPIHVSSLPLPSPGHVPPFPTSPLPGCTTTPGPASRCCQTRLPWTVNRRRKHCTGRSSAAKRSHMGLNIGNRWSGVRFRVRTLYRGQVLPWFLFVPILNQV